MHRATPIVLIAVALAAACRPAADESSSAASNALHFGSTFSHDDAIPARQIIERAAEYVGTRIVTAGVIREICRPELCWLSLDAGSGRLIRIAIRDSANRPVEMPLEVIGRWAFVDGLLESVAAVDSAAAAPAPASAPYALQVNAVGVQVVNPTSG